MGLAVVASGILAACYGGAQAQQDINAAWRGHTRAQLEAHWRTPTSVERDSAGTLLVWTMAGRRLVLPNASVSVGPRLVEVRGWTGGVVPTAKHVVARVDERGLVTDVRGPSPRLGPPPELNVHWGVLLGGHVGMGRLDDTRRSLPSGGLYIGGMLTPTIGLVGTYSMAAGKDDGGGAMAFGWGLGVQTWVTSRTWLRVGPALVLAFDPGFENAGLEPGLAVGGSYAIVRQGGFVLDLRIDLTGGSTTSFGTVGLGVNLN